MPRVYAKARNSDPAVPFNSREKLFRSGRGFAVDVRVIDYQGTAAKRYAEGVIIGFWESAADAHKVARAVNSGEHYGPGHHFHERAHSAIVVPAWNASVELGDELPWETREGSAEMVAAYELAGVPLPAWLLEVIARLNREDMQTARRHPEGGAHAHAPYRPIEYAAEPDLAVEEEGTSPPTKPEDPVREHPLPPEGSHPELLDKDLLGLVLRAVDVGEVIMTLGTGRPNRIVSISADGIRVATEKSERKGTGPQLVPAWMIAVAWNHLRRYGHLSQKQLVDELNVKRSAFICALLSRLPNVDVETFPRVSLRLVSRRRDAHDAAMAVSTENATNTESVDSDGTTDTINADAESNDAESIHGGTFAERLNHLFDTVHPDGRGPFTPEEIAEALQADGILLHPNSISRLRQGIGVPPGEGVTYALAFFFNVDPDYFLAGIDTSTPPEASNPVAQEVSVRREAAREAAARGADSLEESSRVRRSTGTDVEMSTAEILRINAGLSQAARYCSGQSNVDQNLVHRLVSVLSETGPLLLQALSGEVLVPTHFLEHVVAAWAETSLPDSGTESDFLWLAEMLNNCLDD